MNTNVSFLFESSVEKCVKTGLVEKFKTKRQSIKGKPIPDPIKPKPKSGCC